MNTNHFMRYDHYNFSGKKDKNIENFNLGLANKITINLLKSFFSSLIHNNNIGVLISTPTFTMYNSICVYPIINGDSVNPISPSATLEGIEKIIGKTIKVQVFYYVSLGGEVEINYLSDNSKKALSIVIHQLYPSTIQVELQLVQQHQPYINASILAQYLSINASKYGFHRIITILLNAVPYYNPSTPLNFSDNILNFCITGLKVQLSGLLTTQRNRARKTVYTVSAGTFHSNSKINNKNISIPYAYSHYGKTGKINIDFSQSTYKSREGAFNIKVYISSIPATQIT